jgi:hypothetical protein
VIKQEVVVLTQQPSQAGGLIAASEIVSSSAGCLFPFDDARIELPCKPSYRVSGADMKIKRPLNAVIPANQQSGSDEGAVTHLMGRTISRRPSGSLTASPNMVCDQKEPPFQVS